MFIATADEYGIRRFEKELGIEPSPEQGLEERRVAVLIKAAKKNLSFKDVQNILFSYSEELVINPDYNSDELEVIAGDHVSNLKAVYDILDALLPLQIYIYFAMEIMVYLKFLRVLKELTLETGICLSKDSKSIKGKEIELEFIIKNVTEIFETEIEAVHKDAWFLDGTVTLDGSRYLNSQVITEVL